MIYTSRDTLRAVLFEYRDAVRPIGDWIGLLGLVISLWALRGTVAHPGWQGAVAALGGLASIYLLVGVGNWVKRGCPGIDSVVDKLIADSDKGYAYETAKGQLEVHHVTPPGPPASPPAGADTRKTAVRK